MKYYLGICWQGASFEVEAECRRYAGLLGKKPSWIVTKNSRKFELYPQPKGCMFHRWAEQNCRRMATFGVVAMKIKYAKKDFSTTP